MTRVTFPVPLTGISNVPSIPDMAPVSVPFIRTEAPGSGSPMSSIIVPVTLYRLVWVTCPAISGVAACTTEQYGCPTHKVNTHAAWPQNGKNLFLHILIIVWVKVSRFLLFAHGLPLQSEQSTVRKASLSRKYLF